MTEDSEDEEDWVFSSVRLYQQLHMFQLSLSPSQLALSPDGCHLALADSDRAHLEVYRLPGKLVAASEEEGLTSNRDFQLVCGTVECPAVSSLQYVGRRGLVTTSRDRQAVSLWRWQAGEDLLQLTGEENDPRKLVTAVDGEEGAASPLFCFCCFASTSQLTLRDLQLSANVSFSKWNLANFNQIFLFSSFKIQSSSCKEQ